MPGWKALCYAIRRGQDVAGIIDDLHLPHELRTPGDGAQGQHRPGPNWSPERLVRACQASPLRPSRPLQNQDSQRRTDDEPDPESKRNMGIYLTPPGPMGGGLISDANGAGSTWTAC